MYCVKAEILLGSFHIKKKLITMSNISIHVTGVSMNTSGKLLSSTLLKESGKSINNMPIELIHSVCEALVKYFTVPPVLFLRYS